MNIRQLLLVLLTLTVPARTAAAQTTERDQTGDQAAVRAFVESFLTRLGDRRLDTLDADFAPKALIIVVRQRDGEWISTSQTAEEWLAALRRAPAGTPFREPITNVAITIDDGHLAHVRADFDVVREGRALSSGVDHFTLVRDSAGWKIVMIAYTSRPAGR